MNAILILKYSSLVIVSLLVIGLGSMAVAWRRACVYVTKEVYPFEKLSGENINKFTPSHINLWIRFVLGLLILSGILAFIFFNWKVALAVIVLNYALIELFRLLYPNKYSEFYLANIENHFVEQIALVRRFNQKEDEQEMQNRLELFYKRFKPDKR